MPKELVILLEAGSIGQAIASGISQEEHLIIAYYEEYNANKVSKFLNDAGFKSSAVITDLGVKKSIFDLMKFAQSKGTPKYLVNVVDVSSSQVSVNEILKVDLYGTRVLVEEFGKEVCDKGLALVISFQNGHRLPALTLEGNKLFISSIVDALAYQYSKRCNVLRIMYEASRYGKRRATVNSISLGIIITSVANDESHGPRKDGYLNMIKSSPAKRTGTPDGVGELTDFIMDEKGRFINGMEILIDGGTTASYWYGDLQYLQETH